MSKVWYLKKNFAAIILVQNLALFGIILQKCEQNSIILALSWQ